MYVLVDSLDLSGHHITASPLVSSIASLYVPISFPFLLFYFFLFLASSSHVVVGIC